VPIILVINKVDNLKNRDRLLPIMQHITVSRNFSEIVPVSVKSGYNMDHLYSILEQALPSGPAGFPEDQITDRSQRFLAGELVREKMFRYLGEELPYTSAVEISRFELDAHGTAHIDATIWVEKTGQKAIVIGKNGLSLKNIGQRAREEMERLFQCKVFLECWVKVRKGWTNDAQVIKSLGYDE
jgi:GTPase